MPKKILKFISWLLINSWFFSVPLYLLLIGLLFLPNDLILLMGVLLRLLGTVIVIVGISKKLKKFSEGGQGIGAIFKNWWLKYPFSGKLFQAEAYGTISAEGRANTTKVIKYDKNMPVNKKLDTLHKMIKKIKVKYPLYKEI